VKWASTRQAINNNVRELEGVLKRLIVMAKISKHPVDLELAQQALADLLRPTAEHYNPASIGGTVAAITSLPPRTYPGPAAQGSRAGRQVAAYIIREETPTPWPTWGSSWATRTHDICGRNEKIASQINLDSTLRQEVADIHAQLQARTLASG